jgi:DNA-binding CsgD family transcriptional regulator
MTTKGTKVTPREKKRMWELYQQLNSYKAVAKKMKRSPDTVSRHVKEYEIAVSVANYLTQGN